MPCELPKRFIIFLLSCLFFLSLFPAVSAEQETQYPLNSYTKSLINSKYFPVLLNAIKSAQKSIYICMYYLPYYQDKKGKVDEILNALLDAKGRGVNIEVVLDRGYEEVGDGSNLTYKNVRAFSFLIQAGIPVFYDDLKTLTHSKYFIIDEAFVIAGSANLSEQALSSNREAGFLVRSPEVTQEFLDEFKSIPRFSPEPVKDAIPIPLEFMRNRELASKMVNKGDPRAMDVYLWFQKKSFETKSATIEITEAELMENFFKGRDISFKTKTPFEKITGEQLSIYLKKYPFIKAYHRDAVKNVLIIELKDENKLAEDSLYLSSLYWSDGWKNRLSQRAKFSILYVLDKTASGRCGRYFSQLKYDAVKEYGVNHAIFAIGTTELQRFNLIDKDINFRIGETNANGFTLNEFYVYEDFQKAFDKLKAETNPELFKTVSGLAEEVNEVSDLEVYKRFIALGLKYGLAPLTKILSLCRSHSNGISPYRQYFYVEKAITNAALGKSGVKTDE